MQYKKTAIEKSNLAIAFIVLFITTIIMLLSDRILPEQYLRDHRYFLLYGASERSQVEQDSYSIIVNFYSSIGLLSDFWAIKLFNLVVFELVLLITLWPIIGKIESGKFTLYIVFYNTLLIFYASGITKEIISSLLCLFLYYINRSSKYWVYFWIPLILIGILFRPYYLLILAIMIFIIALHRLRRKKVCKSRIVLLRWGFYVITFASILFSLPEKILSSMPFEPLNEVKNVRHQLISDISIYARSTIEVEPFGSSIILNLFQFLKIIFQVLVPIKLIGGGVYSLGTFLIIIILSYMILRASFRFDLEGSARANINAIFLYSFFIASLFFEPDLGSMSRHIFPYLPLVYSVIESRNRYSKVNLDKNV